MVINKKKKTVFWCIWLKRSTHVFKGTWLSFEMLWERIFFRTSIWCSTCGLRSGCNVTFFICVVLGFSCTLLFCGFIGKCIVHLYFVIFCFSHKIYFYIPRKQIKMGQCHLQVSVISITNYGQLMLFFSFIFFFWGEKSNFLSFTFTRVRHFFT